jgi:hypothetical protein
MTATTAYRARTINRTRLRMRLYLAGCAFASILRALGL